MRGRMRTAAIVGAVSVLLLSSCASAFVKRPPLRPAQLMGKSGNIVITVDAKSQADLVGLAFGGIEELGKRSQRLSIALKSEESTYPLDLERASMWAVIEGDYPAFLVNTALMYVPSLRRDGADEELTWFTQKDGSLSLRAVGKDAILVTDGPYEEAWSAYKGNVPLIDEATVRQMEGSDIALYAKRPKTFFDLGLDLPQSIYEMSESVLFLLNGSEAAGYKADAIIEMQSEKDASTLSQMVRSGYVATLRKEGKAVNIALLKQMFLLDGKRLLVKDMEVPPSALSALKRHVTDII